MKNAASRGWAGVARLGGVGDNLVTASVLRPLKKMGYMVDVITSEPNHVVYHNNPYIDKLSVKKPEDLPAGGVEAWQEWFRSRAAEYDLFANLSHSMEGRHAFFPHMTQFWWPEQYRRKLAAGSYLETVHDIIGLPYDFGPLFFPTDAEQEQAIETKRKIGSKCIGWVIAGSRLDKLYPYSALAVARIIKELSVPVVAFGAPNERQHSSAKAIMEHLERVNSTHDGYYVAMSVQATPGKSADPGGHMDWPLRRSLTQLLHCDLVITPDTGSAWAVAMEPMPKVVMVSHASAENITKHWVNTCTLAADQERVPCHPCHRLHNQPSTCNEVQDGSGSAACMHDISVEDLISNVKKLWHREVVSHSHLALAAE